MRLDRKDVGATALTAAAVMVFLAAYRSWDIWLVGSSNRWAAAGILALGIGSCALGKPRIEGGTDATTVVLGAIGALALVLGALAIITGSITALALLTAADVALWAGATLRHAWAGGHQPMTA